MSQQPHTQQPTTARGGFALMPVASGADAGFGGGSSGGDAAMRAQVISVRKRALCVGFTRSVYVHCI